MIKYNFKKEKEYLEDAVANIEEGFHFVAYNTKFLGLSAEENIVIKGKNTENSESLDEVCFGYGPNGELNLLEVYVMPSGIKYAATELMMGTYGFWLVTEPPRNKNILRNQMFKKRQRKK